MGAFIGNILRTTARQCAMVAAMSFALSAVVLAQEQPLEIRAATILAPPFVIKQGDQLTGFSIEVWREVADRLKAKTSYRLAPDPFALEAMAKSNDIDVVISPAFYTTARARAFDFSLPIMETGMQVMVREDGASGQPSPLRDVLATLYSRSAAKWLGVALLIILLPAHVLWLLDRGSEDSVSPTRSYFPGIFHALYWAASALVSQVEQSPRQWLARLIGLCWMFVGVLFVALYTAQLTATLTVQRIRGAIDGPDDLPGRQVAVVANTDAAVYLRKIKAVPVQVQSLEEMFSALLDHRADAAFLGAPMLQFFASHDGMGRVRVVGPEVNRGNLGFVFKLDSPLRREVNTALISLREDGTYDRIYEKWFGSQ